jgi:hypothetical protein
VENADDLVIFSTFYRREFGQPGSLTKVTGPSSSVRYTAKIQSQVSLSLGPNKSFPLSLCRFRLGVSLATPQGGVSSIFFISAHPPLPTLGCNKISKEGWKWGEGKKDGKMANC